MSTTMKGGRVVAKYTDDGLGRRLTVGEFRPGQFSTDGFVFATNQREAKEAIKVLRELTEELPP